MKLIIDIPEKTIAHIRSDYGHGCKVIYDKDKDKIVDAIYHSIPLPKEHGRLIDADVLVDGLEDDYEFCEVVNATPTIIEAEKRNEC